jgi:hypothetical protein
MFIENYILLYGLFIIVAGIWAEYRYRCGVNVGYEECSLDKFIEDASVIYLLLDKGIIRVDNDTGIVYGIADSMYNPRDDFRKIMEKHK